MILSLAFGGWRKETTTFCKKCAKHYNTLDEAKSVCEQDKKCGAVYDLFCDGAGKFCTCRFSMIVEQTHPKAIDCIYRKP